MVVSPDLLYSGFHVIQRAVILDSVFLSLFWSNHHSTTIQPPFHHRCTTPSTSQQRHRSTPPSTSQQRSHPTTLPSNSTLPIILHTTPFKLTTTPSHQTPTHDQRAPCGHDLHAGAKQEATMVRGFSRPFLPPYCLPRSDSRPTSSCTGWGRGDPSRGSKVKKGGVLFSGE